MEFINLRAGGKTSLSRRESSRFIMSNCVFVIFQNVDSQNTKKGEMVWFSTLQLTLMWFLVKIYRPSQHEGMDFPENDVSLSVVSKNWCGKL